ncbi:hypothetical protein ABID23_001445 [Bartonella silvatica]|uniref:Uncharacterized protein n=1 Tax=Bartonella silvatica TaxID=357760 RepID=A0ABV2HIG0_9HYPH
MGLMGEGFDVVLKPAGRGDFNVFNHRDGVVLCCGDVACLKRRCVEN